MLTSVIKKVNYVVGIGEYDFIWQMLKQNNGASLLLAYLKRFNNVTMPETFVRLISDYSAANSAHTILDLTLTNLIKD